MMPIDFIGNFECGRIIGGVIYNE
ncbi:hypothetical protein [Candidatus Williamhamiltonella defendens]